MKKRIIILLFIAIGTVYIMSLYDVSRIETLNSGKYDYIYLKKKEGDSLEVYNYFFGGKEREVRKALLDDYSNLPTSEITSYYRNGNVETYRFYVDKYLSYYRHYNDEGVTTKYDGHGILYPSDTSFVQNIVMNTHYRNYFKLVKPPNTEIVLLMGDVVDNERERDYDINPFHDMPIVNSTSYYDIKHEKPGAYKDVVYLFIRDTVSDDIQEVHTTFEYLVGEDSLMIIN